MKKHWLLIPVAASSCLMPLVSCGQEPEPIPKDKFEKMYDYYLELVQVTTNIDSYRDKSVDEIMQTIAIEQHDVETYYFNDINYDDQSPSLWQPHQHVLRALQIAVVASLKQNNTMMEIAVKLLLYWLNHNYISTANNWWFNEIGVPRDISSLALIVYDKLTETYQNTLLEWINHGTLSGCEEARSRTGTNLFWHAEISIKYSILTKNESELELVCSEVNDEIKEDDNEGFQSDGSYFQHDRQMYTGGYGRQGVMMLCRILGATSVAGYTWDPSKLSIVSNFIINGAPYFVHKKSFNYSCMGRTYTRKTSFQIDGGSTDLGNIDEFRYILSAPNLDNITREKINSVLSKWRAGTSTFSGVKYFPKSCFITMNLDGIYMSFEGVTGGLKNCEKGNGENELAYNMSYGTNTCVMETGNEYSEIAPVWDYAAIPGTTSYYETDNELFAKRELIGSTHTGTFNGGMIENTEIAVSMQQMTHEDTSYTVTAFGTPYGLVILGGGLSNTNEKQLYTTVEQALPNEPIIIKDSKTVLHSNVAYTNLIDDSCFDVETNNVKGNWGRNNPSAYPGEDDVYKDVFKITINNDSASDKTRYAYCIQPKSMLDKKFECIISNGDYQAILMPDGKHILAAFYKTGSFVYDEQEYGGEKGRFYLFNKV